MLCGNFAGIDKLERLKLLQSDPLVDELNIGSKNRKRYHGFWATSVIKPPDKLREMNFKVFRKLLRKSKRKAITIDIDSGVVNVEGHQVERSRDTTPKSLEIAVTTSSLLSAMN